MCRALHSHVLGKAQPSSPVCAAALLSHPPLSCSSLRQLKREVADRLAAKQAVAPHLFSKDEDVEGDGEYIGTVRRCMGCCMGLSLA